MNIFSRTFVSILVIGASLALLLPLAAQEMVEPIVTVQNVRWSDETEVEGAEAILTRMEHGISMTMETTGLEPGDVYTVWWFIFNTPENCSDGLCGFDDTLLMDDEGQFILDENGQRQPNFAGMEATQVSGLRATGTIADEAGVAVFRAHLPIGDLTDDVLFGPGLLDPMGAEVHLGVRTHGPAQPDILSEQLLTAWGGCPDPMDRSPCADIQVSIFNPPVS